MDNVRPLFATHSPDMRQLRGLMEGEVITPTDPAWDTRAEPGTSRSISARQRSPSRSRSPTCGRSSTSPARRGCVAPQGTGHGAAALGALAETLLAKLHRLRGVEIDPSRRARVQAGVIWSEVVEAAAEHGLAALAGSSPDVGVVGYTLGGGLSWLARKYGIGANHVTGAEIVTADGRTAASTAGTSLTCSGRSAAAVATSASSQRSSSPCSRTARSMPARSGSRSNVHTKCSAPGVTGRPACPSN